MKIQTATKWLVAASAAVAMIGCNGGESSDSSKPTATSSTSTESKAKKDLKIAMIAKSSTNPVFLSARTGAEDAAKELGEKNGIKITIDWETPPTEDGQVQAQNLAAAVNAGADAVLISCSDAAKVTGAINDAVAKGVPVMTFDSDAPQSKRFAFYGANDESVGRQVMQELAALAGKEPLNVAILRGNQMAPNLQKRTEAVIDEAKKFPNVKVVGQFSHKETPEDATQEVIKDNNAYPTINAWAMVGGWPLFNTSLLSLDATKYKIVAVDALPAELSYVEKGIAPVLLAQPTYEWGHTSVGLIVDKLQGKDVEAINEMKLVKVTKANLGDWARQLQKWGFKDVDKKFLDLK